MINKKDYKELLKSINEDSLKLEEIIKKIEKENELLKLKNKKKEIILEELKNISNKID